MTPKGKALDLVRSFYEVYPVNGSEYGMEWGMAKQCALIAVDEIIDAIDWHDYETPNKQIEYWQQVKTEIENL